MHTHTYNPVKDQRSKRSGALYRSPPPSPHSTKRAAKALSVRQWRRLQKRFHMQRAP